MSKFIKHGNFYLCSSCNETEDACTCEPCIIVHVCDGMEHWEDDITDDTQELFEDFDYDEFDMLLSEVA